MRLSKLDKLKLYSRIVKAVSVTATGSAVMSDANKWVALSILIVGAVADAIISFLKEQENKKG
jgi:hypothetical protein